MVITMKDYDVIRKRYIAGESQRSIAKSLGISRNTVAKYCEGAAVPWERKTPERTSTVLTAETIRFIRSCLEEDNSEGLKKQKHTAKRIYDRLVDETGFTGGESTVRAKVRELKQTMPAAFLPLLFDPGEALQIDWGEAFVYIKGNKEKINLFCARLCYSCRPFVLAYHRQNEESFLDAFVRIFRMLGGVPSKVIFDNGNIVGIKAYPEKIEIYAGGDKISEHERCYDQHQNRYHLEDYLPLLEIRSRAFFNAAPVRQNIPQEVLEEWQTKHTDHKAIIAYLKTSAGAEAPAISDPVRIRTVDLHEYDSLKEAAYAY